MKPVASTLTVVGVLFGHASAVDCSSAIPWSKTAFGGYGTQVHYENNLYKNEYWAEPSHVPGAGAPWTLIGECDAGTAGSDVAAEGVADCSEAFPYKSGSYYPNPNFAVHYLGSLYLNGYYADATMVPGSHEVWKAQGTCESGTASTGATGTVVDCTGVHLWAKSYAYATAGEKAHYGGRLFTVTSWSQGDVPGEGGYWTFSGTCREGTNTTGTHDNPNELSSEIEALLCHCCQGCAENRVGNPVCHDDVADEDSCLYSWCPKHNTFNEAECTRIKEDQQLTWFTDEIVSDNKVWPDRIYIPYIDAGLAKQPDIVEIAKTYGVKHFIIAFITAQISGTECRGAFAGVIPFRTGPTAWNGEKQGNDYLYEKLNELRELGGSITLSHGGANGIELADDSRCTDVVTLKNAYKEIVEFLKLSHIDFDIEGNAYASIHRQTGWKNRFEAVKLLVQEIPDLKVWWTLPILPSGLTADGLMFISDMMESGVNWDRFNVMTMDYGDENICDGTKMHECEISAIQNLALNFFNTASSLGKLAEYGWKSPEDVYPRLGSTPMLGMNDLTHEVYTPEDAKKSLKVWQDQYPVGIISNWSVQRDAPCSATYVSTDCSSINVQTEDLEYLKIFAPYTSE